MEILEFLYLNRKIVWEFFSKKGYRKPRNDRSISGIFMQFQLFLFDVHRSHQDGKPGIVPRNISTLHVYTEAGRGESFQKTPRMNVYLVVALRCTAVMMMIACIRTKVGCVDHAVGVREKICAAIHSLQRNTAAQVRMHIFSILVSNWSEMPHCNMLHWAQSSYAIPPLHLSTSLFLHLTAASTNVPINLRSGCIVTMKVDLFILWKVCEPHLLIDFCYLASAGCSRNQATEAPLQRKILAWSRARDVNRRALKHFILYSSLCSQNASKILQVSINYPGR